MTIAISALKNIDSGHKTCLIVPVNCSWTGLSSLPFPLGGAMLNTANDIATEINTEESANSRPKEDKLGMKSIRGKHQILPGHILDSGVDVKLE